MTDRIPPAFDVVEARDVSRHYGRRRALARVSFSCHAGAIVGLFGPNGAGKSTLIGILSTLVRPSTGHVLYGSRPAMEWGQGLRGAIGLLGHDLFLYGDLTAYENLRFFGRLHGLSDLDARIDRSLVASGLVDRRDDRVSGFSRGLRQRLALERALLHDPRLVLLDEPFTGLDDESAGRLRSRLAGLRGAGAIVVMATHDFETAEGLVDRPFCLAEGRARTMVEAGGTLRERYRRTMAERRA